ncbi:VTT domain-containing protein [Mucilaginibacter sp. HMF5004]|uniref:DedA family protein n=1 Tax=Mucilaginibacter rivuli TaxID=2857527 RepID=UPI001C5F12C8|nr:VTT domain-containing protein [Mucilaginibacter rivuli]MBW4890523.1 VTT domain-containing protein [Mucilaginibacter rivuli]
METFWEHLKNLTDAGLLLSEGGFYLLLVVVFAETGLFFGFFLPGDYLLFLAGVACSTGMLDISIYLLVVSLIVAGFLGNWVGYWFGYRTGPVLFKREDSLFFKKRYVHTAEDFYNKYGGMALVMGRFFPIIRTFAPIFAGVVKVDFKKFTFYNLIGSIAWVTTLTLSGYFLGRRYPQIKDYLQYIVIGLIVVTTIPLLIAFLRKKLLPETNDEINNKT